jgi:transcriptional regulator with XRE-family HTH domain
MKLSEKLRLLREETGKTQEMVCNEIGIGIQTLRNYENDAKNKVPSTIQLKMLKDYYHVTYEYLLDEDCENKTNESVDIGKKLKLSDTALNNIINLQFSNGRIPQVSIEELKPDRKSPQSFNNWLEVTDIQEFVVLLDEYKTLNEILETLQYFISIDKMEDYLIYCLDNKVSLDDLFSIIEKQFNEFTDKVSQSIFTTLYEHGADDLNIELDKLRKYCKNYKKGTSKKEDLSEILVFIQGTGEAYKEETYRTIKFCLFETTDLIKNEMEENYGKLNNLSIPSEYENMNKIIKKKVKK